MYMYHVYALIHSTANYALVIYCRLRENNLCIQECNYVVKGLLIHRHLEKDILTSHLSCVYALKQQIHRHQPSLNRERGYVYIYII